MIANRLVRLIGWVGVAFFVLVGLWAFFSPKSFYDQLAVFPPYNKHFLHDVGSFQIGLGTVLVLALLNWNSLATAFGGTALGSAFHTVAHFMDRDLGGKDSTNFGLVVLTIALAWAAWQTRPQKSVLRA
jgi:hypothetical protein